MHSFTLEKSRRLCVPHLVEFSSQDLRGHTTSKDSLLVCGPLDGGRLPRPQAFGIPFDIGNCKYKIEGPFPHYHLFYISNTKILHSKSIYYIVGMLFTCKKSGFFLHLAGSKVFFEF